MSKMFWHPKTGEPKVFADNETQPPDWLDFHPRDPGKEAPKPPFGDTPMTKAELADALKAGGITYPSDATAATMSELLVTALRANLDQRQIAYDPQDGARKLLTIASTR